MARIFNSEMKVQGEVGWERGKNVEIYIFAPF